MKGVGSLGETYQPRRRESSINIEKTDGVFDRSLCERGETGNYGVCHLEMVCLKVKLKIERENLNWKEVKD